MAGRYTRTKFLCLAEGHAQGPEFFNLSPVVAGMVKNASEKYQDFFKHGFEKGTAMADADLSRPSNYAADICRINREMGEKFPK